MVSDTVMERCEAGASWLDAEYPGWELRVDLEALDVSDCTVCMLGQIAGSYADVLECLGLVSREEYIITYSHPAAQWAAAHGFERLGSWSVYEDLTAAWKAFILARRASATARKRARAPITEGELVTA